MAVASAELAATGWRVPRRSEAFDSDLLLPAEIVDTRDRARRFADDYLQPLAHELNTTPEDVGVFRHEVLRAIADAGLLGLLFKEDVGGAGLEHPTLAAITALEEIAYYVPGVASAMVDAQVLLAGKVLDEIGGDLRRRFLPGIIRGEIVASFATSEPEASTDLSARSVQTVATPRDGGWSISGRKRWITNAPAADIIVLLCRTDVASLSILVVETDRAGITISKPDRKMGNHAQLTADIVLDDVYVPEANVVGGVGRGLTSALGALTLGRIGIGAVGVGMAQRAFDVATAYASRRRVYDEPIAGNQYWQYRFAEHALEIEAARSLYQKAAMLADRTGKPGAFAAMAKIKGSALAVDVARDAVQICGGYGFARSMTGAGQDWPLESIYRDAKVGEIYEGANEVQKWIIARQIFGRDITG